MKSRGSAARSIIVRRASTLPLFTVSMIAPTRVGTRDAEPTLIMMPQLRMKLSSFGPDRYRPIGGVESLPRPPEMTSASASIVCGEIPIICEPVPARHRLPADLQERIRRHAALPARLRIPNTELPHHEPCRQ